MIGRGPKSCLLILVTELLSCIYVKPFLHYIFNSLHFWSSMSCKALGIEFVDINVSKELGVFIDVKFQGYSLCLPKKYKPTKRAFRWTRNLQGMVWNSGCKDYSETPNILPGELKDEYFGEGTEKCKILGSFFDKEVENLDDHGCPKFRDLADEETCICSSFPFRHKTTLHCADSTTKLPGDGTMQQITL